MVCPFVLPDCPEHLDSNRGAFFVKTDIGNFTVICSYHPTLVKTRQDTLHLDPWYLSLFAYYRYHGYLGNREDFSWKLVLGILLKYVHTIQPWLKLDKNNGHFTSRPTIFITTLPTIVTTASLATGRIFRENWYWGFSLKYIDTIQLQSKMDKNNEHFTWRFTHIYCYFIKDGYHRHLGYQLGPGVA